jgi:hypothetical protein
MGLDKFTNEAVLTVVDHLAWDDVHKHTKLLSEKLNKYFGFVESGEVYGSYPEAEGRKLRIDIVCRFEPTAAAVAFLEKARAAAGEYDARLAGGRMLHNRSIDTDPQQQEAASRRMLWSGHLRLQGLPFLSSKKVPQ